MGLILVIAILLHVFGTSNGQTTYPPRFIKMPRKEELFMYHEATKIDCVADAYPAPKYRWIRNSQEFSYQRNDGRYSKWPNEGTLVFALPGQDDDGMYQCIAENAFGVAVSNVINMRRADLNDFKIKPMKTIDATPGESLTLKCEWPTSYPLPIVAWSTEDSNGQLVTIKETNRRALDIDGNLVIAMVTEEDNAVFICSVKNIYLRQMKYGERTKVNVRNGKSVDTPCQNVARSPEKQIAIVGETVQLKCVFSGSPVPQYTWKKNDEPPEFVQNSHYLSIINGGTVLEIKVVGPQVGGFYLCVGRNERTSTFAQFSYNVIVVSRPTFTIKPEDTFIPENGSHVFRCEAEGIPTPSIKWTINGKDPSQYLDGVRKRIVGNTVYLTNMNTTDSAVFQCNASNIHGYAFTNAFVNVMRDKPMFVVPPQAHMKMAEGQRLDIHCQTFSAPKAIITWTKDGRPINGGKYIQLESGDLRLESLVPSDAGVYECTARNGFGSRSARGELVVRSRTRICIRPLETRIYENMDVKLVCTGDTDPMEIDNLRVNWYKDGNLIDVKTNPRVQYNIQDSSLVLSGTLPRDTGIYTCNVTNGLDFDLALASVVIEGRPERPEVVALDCVNEILKNTAILSWRSGAENYSPIIRYIIEYATQYEVDTWYAAETIAQNNTRDTNAAKVLLRPHIRYQFRLRSQNRVGISEPSLPTSTNCVVPPNVPSNNPRELFVYATTSNNLVVQWSVMPYIEHNGPNLGYDLSVSCLDCDKTPKNVVNVTTISWWQQDRYTFTDISFLNSVYNIEPFKTYQASIRARNDLGQSSADSTVSQGYSGGPAPDVVPQEVAIVSNSSNLITVQWRILSKSDLMAVNGFFRGYRVEWCPASMSQGDCNMKKRFKDVIIQNFTIPINYSGKRRRRSVDLSQGNVPTSPMARMRRQAISIFPNSMEGATAPLHNSVILPQNAVFETRLSRRRRDISYGQLIQTNLTDIPGNTSIRVWVRVLNSIFAGPPSKIIELVTPLGYSEPVEGLKVINIDATYADVQWQPPSDNGGNLLGFRLEVQEIYPNLQLGHLTPLPPIYDNTLVNYRVTALKPKSTYRIFVWPINSVGVGAETFIDVETPPADRAPSPPTFTVSQLGVNGFNVTFEPSRTGIPGSVFVAQYRQKGVNRWEMSEAVYLRRWINITYLLEDEWYDVRMMATNGENYAAQSNFLTVKTGGSRPYKEPLQGINALWFILVILILIALTLAFVGIYFLRLQREEKLYGKEPLINEDKEYPINETDENIFQQEPLNNEVDEVPMEDYYGSLYEGVDQNGSNPYYAGSVDDNSEFKQLNYSPPSGVRRPQPSRPNYGNNSPPEAISPSTRSQRQLIDEPQSPRNVAYQPPQQLRPFNKFAAGNPAPGPNPGLLTDYDYSDGSPSTVI